MKLVVGHQLKSTVRYVHSQPITTESGQAVDIVFGARSMDSRIVDSAVEMGLAATLLEHITQQVIEAYDS